MSKGGKLFAPVIMQKMGREENVVIKCFKTPKCYYFYDRNTDSIVKITRGQYELLKNVEQEKHYDHILALEGLFAQGFLKTSIVEKIEHPETKSIKFLSDNYVHMLLLQVTQQCNLRCSYCAYSGNYNNRIHDSQKMNFNTAQNAIDFYFYHSKNREELSIGFYGGEPLIEFSLIKKCVEYCEEHKSGKEINYRVTTNGTLINDVIIDFFIKYNFSVTISLDGDKEAHDKNRKFRDGRGSFDLILKNLSKIREKNDWFYGNNIFFNTVVDPKVSIDSMQNKLGKF